MLHTYDAAEATTTDQSLDVISDTAEKKNQNTSQYINICICKAVTITLDGWADTNHMTEEGN